MSKKRKKKTDKNKGELMYTNGSKHNFLGQHGMVDVDRALKAMRYATGEELIDIGHVNESSKMACILVDKNAKPYGVNDDIAEKYAKYKIVPLGYVDRQTGYFLYGSFLKSGLGWEGIYVGDIKRLFNRINSFENGDSRANKNPIVDKLSSTIQLMGDGMEEILENLREDIQHCVQNEEEEFNSIFGTALKDYKVTESDIKEANTMFGEIEKEYKIVENEDELSELCNDIQNAGGVEELLSNDLGNMNTSGYRPMAQLNDSRAHIYNQVYERLLNKENWKRTSKNRLGFYLKASFAKVMQDQEGLEGNIGNGFILSKDHTKCVVNTGLIDIYNNDIYLLDKTNSEKNFYNKDIEIISSKATLIGYGFDKEDILDMPEPIRYYTDRRELVFEGTIEEFDLEDDYRLNHIINERRHRFPEEYREVQSDTIADKLKLAIRQALKMQMRDYNHIVPFYSISERRIQHLIPLRLTSDTDEEVELAIVVGRNNGIWCVYTILNTEDAYDNVRLITRPDNTWLKLKDSEEDGATMECLCSKGECCGETREETCEEVEETYDDIEEAEEEIEEQYDEIEVI